MMNKLLSVILILCSYAGYSQVGIGTPMPNASSQLEIVANDKGLLIPRINLTGSTDTTTITTGNVNSLLVFNTATISDIKPGYYYWYDNKWNRVIISNEITISPGTVIYNPTNQQFSYIDNTGTTQVIDITSIIKASETLTTLTNNGAGSYTYKNEIGTDVNIDVVGDVISNASSIFNDPAVTNILEQISNNTEGNVTFDSTTNQFSYVDNTGTTQVIDITSIIKASETLTTLTNNGAGSYTYKNEIGTDVSIDVVGDVISNASSIFNDPAVTNILEQISNNTEGNVTFDSTTNQFSYVDNTGTTQVIDITSIIKASETLTTLTNNGAGSYTYKNEIGTDVNIDVVGDVISNASSIFNDPAVTNILEQISNNTEGNVTFDSTTNQFSYVDNTGTTQVIDITSIIKASETLTTLTNNGAGSYTYKNEIGTDVNIDVVGDVISNASTILNDPVFVTELTNVIQDQETVTNLSQNLTSGTITYSNEAGVASISQVISTDAANIITVGTDGGALLTPSAITLATTVSNTSSGNDLSTTVNGVTGTVIPIINTNVLDTSGNLLTATINGITSNTIDLTSAITAGETTTNMLQDPVTGIITYTNENADSQTAILRSNDAGNIITVGTDGGALLTPSAITSATTVSNTSSGNDLSTTVNGVTGTVIPIINTNVLDTSGNLLTATINGITSNTIDLTSAITAGETTTNMLQDPVTGIITYTNENADSQTAILRSNDAANIITVGTDGGALLTPSAITSATTVSNTSSGNDLSTTVNGVTGTVIPIINTNILDTSGNLLTATINGITSNTIDLTSAITAGETTTNMLQDPVTGIITYTNENADSQTAILRSNDAGNIITVGTDGGTLLTPSAITSATTVSNTSSGNDLSTTVNGVTGTAIPIINTNVLDTSGNTLTSTINGIASNALDLTSVIAAGTTNDLNLAGNTLTSNVNGIISTTGAVSSVSNASTTNIATVTVNGLASTGAPIINTNILDTAGNSLTSTVNGVVSNAVDLTSAIAAGTTNDLSLTDNTLTSNVNGIISTSETVSGVSNSSIANTSTVTVNGVSSTGAPIINTNITALTGANLTTTINGIASTALDLTPAIAAGTTNTLSLLGNTLTSNVNGIISTSATVSGVSNSSIANTSSVTVNGITSTGAPIVNTNVLETTGNVLTATVNGVVSNTIDLVDLVDNAISKSDITTTTPASVLAVTGTGATLAPATVNIVPSTVEGDVLTTTATGVEWKAPAKPNILGIKITSGDYTLVDDDYTVIARNLTGDITLTLPDPVTNTGRVLVFNQNTVSSGGVALVVNFNIPVVYSDTASYSYIAASVFGGATGGSLKITLQSDGINWYVINYTM